ncbi:hypothetical protein ASG87_03350 [Frateuria sp. Soil773]|nr:hypothetical protein ASG87_03350 [Frateuria sp. Soil773]
MVLMTIFRSMRKAARSSRLRPFGLAVNSPYRVSLGRFSLDAQFASSSIVRVMDFALEAIRGEKIFKCIVQFTSPRKPVCIGIEEASDCLRVFPEMKRLVPELPKRIAVPFDQFSHGIALWNQFFKGCRTTIVQEKVHSEILETFACHGKEA